MTVLQNLLCLLVIKDDGTLRERVNEFGSSITDRLILTVWSDNKFLPKFTHKDMILTSLRPPVARSIGCTVGVDSTIEFAFALTCGYC